MIKFARDRFGRLDVCTTTRIFTTVGRIGRSRSRGAEDDRCRADCVLVRDQVAIELMLPRQGRDRQHRVGFGAPGD